MAYTLYLKNYCDSFGFLVWFKKPWNISILNIYCGYFVQIFLDDLLKYVFFKNLLHYECTSCQLAISSHQNQVGAVSNPPYFDDWKWSTDKRCIHNEVNSLKIHTLVSHQEKIWTKYPQYIFTMETSHGFLNQTKNTKESQ